MSLIRIIGVDVGNVTGIVDVMADGHNVGSVRTFSVKLSGFDCRGDKGNALMQKMRCLALDGDVKPAIVAYELQHCRGAGTYLLLGLMFVVEMQAAACNVLPLAIHTATLKKRITGSGKAGKNAVIDAVSARIGRRIESEHEADALACALIALEDYRDGKEGA